MSNAALGATAPFESATRSVTSKDVIRVKVTEFDMTFWRLVLFFVKVAFAILPAAILFTIYNVILMTLAAAVITAK